MENSSGEGESDDGEGSEIVECTERDNKQEEVVVEETGDEEVKHEDDLVEETGDEEVKHEDDRTETVANEERETMNDSQVRINFDAEQFSNSYITITVINITIQIHII